MIKAATDAMIECLKSFTYDGYIALLEYIQKKYEIISFDQINANKNPYIILRHDVDASLSDALKMAELETEMNITSTYFFLFSCRYYNLLEKDAFQTITKISDLGHEIGLHYDVSVYDLYPIKTNETLENEIMLLQGLLNKQVKSISMHNPSITAKDDPFKSLPNYINAYDYNLFDLYVSESCRVWHINDLKKLLSYKYDKIQLVIHPLLWREKIVDRKDALDEFFNVLSFEDDKNKQNWIDVWNNHKKVINYDKEIKQKG